MNNKMLFALILLGLLNQSSFILSMRKPAPIPQLSQRQKEEMEAQKKAEALKKKQEKEDALDKLLGHYDCLSERQKSIESIPRVHHLESDHSLEGFNKEKEVPPSPKRETPISPVIFSPKADHPCEHIQQLTLNPNNTDTFLIESTSTRKSRYLLKEEQVKTLIDIFAKIPRCTTIFITLSLSNDSDQTTLAKTFSIEKSVLTPEHRVLTSCITSDQEMITDFFEQFELLTKSGKNSELIPTKPPVESNEQKERRLEMKAAAQEALQILGQANLTDQTSTVIATEPSTNTPTTSFYRSPLFIAGVCSIAACVLAAFYCPHPERFIELFKDFFKNSVSQNLDSSLEQAAETMN